MGWELPLDAVCVKGSFAQIATFAKSRERLRADVHRSAIRCIAVSPKRTMEDFQSAYDIAFNSGSLRFSGFYFPYENIRLRIEICI
jgi:hypothetical protein